METQQAENNQAGATGEATTQQQGADAQDANTAGQPFKVFASQEELDRFMADRAKRAERKALNTQARALGYDDWQEMQDALQAIRKPGSEAGKGAKPSSETATSEGNNGPSEAERYRMMLTVAGELNLPAALIGRLQGNTVDEMRADAQSLLGLLQPGAAASRPNIPAAPQGGQPVTFTQKQLQDPVFVRTHKDEIMKAAREGRIVRS